ncbi:Signal transduction histidine kinase [Saccharicrinis carchari]|uniref:histidine kinase n=1 Tax=Saccharicrinis carchari TaxID=1168039 RepID=A0A521B3D5_SACCC|nr:two-component regulator propeller domain-containing protein [Saccharicrinis carchari]SMO41555.1 Signal transduction histidine kinase [Saccharicrinis carchari]
MLKRMLFFLILGHVFYQAHGMDYEISAQYITMQDGLSNNEVNCILKDNQGFIWFGTPDGLNRYDGFDVKQFYPPGGSLRVNALYQCSKGYIWIGSNEGLHVFNPLDESFLLHYKPVLEDQVTEAEFPITGIAGNLDEGLLLTTPWGLAQLNFTNKRLDANHVVFNWKDQSSFVNADMAATCIVKQSDGIYWIGTNTNKVIRYNHASHKSKVFILSKTNPEAPISIVTDITFSANGVILSTIGHGIYLLNPETGEEDSFSHNNQGGSYLSHNDVYGVVKDSHGDYWAATWDGLDRMKRMNGTDVYEHYNWDHPDFSDKLENRMISLLYDPSGVLWVGTHGGGVVKINLKKKFYKRVKFNSLYEVKDFVEDMDHKLYIAIYHGGIKKTNTPFTPYMEMELEQFSTGQKNIKRQIPTDIVLSSVSDEQGNILFGTLQSSLLHYDPAKDHMDEIKIVPQNYPDWNGRINTMHIDSKKRFWLGTDNGLILYQHDRNIFYLSLSGDQVGGQLSGNNIRAILEDKKGNIWLGTDDGLNKLSYQQDSIFKFKAFNDQQASPLVLSNKEVWALSEMPDGKIWIGYRGGLGYYDPEQGAIRYLTRQNGLAHNFVTCILPYDEQHLWIGTNSGISKLNTGSLKFENYYLANNIRAVHKFKNGYLMWGNNKGLLYFHPDSIQKHNFAPPTRITGISIKNRRLQPGEKVGGKTLLTHAAPFTSSIHLYHPTNSLAIDYVGLSYLNQRSNKYQYRLVNYSNNWTQVNGSQRSVSYNNLPAGEYIFEVRAANSDEVWEENPTTLRIIVHPPWHATLWGRLLILFIIAALFFTIIRLRMRQIYREQKLKAEGRKLEYKLSIANIEREKEHELAEMKTRFFTNVSHELRTPLTLIIAPLKEVLAQEDLSLPIADKLKTVQENANQLYALITQLLDFRKTETGSMPFNPVTENVIPFVKKLIKSFAPYAHSKGVSLKVHKQGSDILLQFDKEKLHSILSNLLSNALKYSQKGQNIITEINSTKTHCLISIKDSGPGMDKAEQEQVFNRFYQTKKSVQPGTGIGLSLVREFVLMHKGTITVESKPGAGAKFTVALPMMKQQQAMSDTENGEKIKEEETLLTAHSNLDFVQSSTPDIPKPIITNNNLAPILIVEDHDQLRSYLTSLLSERFTIHQAGNGEEALKIMKKVSPVLVLSDVMMPIMDGIQLCEAIKTHESYCHIPVILLTAKSNEKDILAGLETGADEYINKPFSPDILKIKIENLISTREQIKSYYGHKITLAPSNIVIDNKDEMFIRTAIQLVEDNLNNPQFNAAMLAENLNMSQPTLYRRIKTFTGDNISVFMRSIRLKRAAQLLASGQYAINEVSEKIGFNDVAYFRKCFHKQFGVTPSKYKVEDH